MRIWSTVPWTQLPGAKFYAVNGSEYEYASATLANATFKDRLGKEEEPV
jgi:hypothetical protein